MRWRKITVPALLVVALSACGSPEYADLEVGDCVIGNPQVEGAYRKIECSEARGALEVESTSDFAYRVGAKGRDDDPGFACGLGVIGITDGEWVICFEPVL